MARKTIIAFTTPKERGFIVKNGLLYEFKKSSISVVKAWPPSRHVKSRRKPFWHYESIHRNNLSFEAMQFSIARAKGEETKSPHEKQILTLAEFYDTIPLHVREKMSLNFSYAWEICDFYARCHNADEIMNKTPALGFMLANYPVFRKILKRRWDGVRRISVKQRRAIAGWLGWPKSEAVAKIIAKIKFTACGAEELLALRKLLIKEPVILKPLSHVKWINFINMELICNPFYRQQCNWRLINEIGLLEDDRLYDIFTMLKDTFSMENYLPTTHGPVQSIKHLKIRHDKAAEEANRYMITDLEKQGIYPTPPVRVPVPSEDFEIYPIDTPLKLYSEAREQKNCVFACYKNEIHFSGGNVYIYSLKKPERATVKIELVSKVEGFVATEVKGPMNCNVATNTKERIFKWLNSENFAMKVEGILSDSREIRSSERCMLPVCPINVPPYSEDFIIEPVTDLRELIWEMRKLNIRHDNFALKRTIGREFHAFCLRKPEKAILLIIKSRYGYTYTELKEFGFFRLSKNTELLLDEWLENS